MGSKTLENFFKHSDSSTKQPLEFWKQLRGSKRNYRPGGPAFAKRTSPMLDLFASQP